MPGYQRAVEVVWRHLEGGGSSSSGSKRGNANTTNTAIPGYYTVAKTEPTLPALKVHWAIRIEAWDTELDDTYTASTATNQWHYLGLVNNKDEHPENPSLCTLDHTAWQSLGDDEHRLRGWTSWSLDEFFSVAQDIIKTWGDYSLTSNNCQHYATTFFILVCDSIEHQDRVLSELERFRWIKRLINVEFDRATGQKIVRNSQGTVVLRSYAGGQNPEVKAAVASGENASLQANPWKWDDRYQQYWRTGENGQVIWYC